MGKESVLLMACSQGTFYEATARKDYKKRHHPQFFVRKGEPVNWQANTQ